MGTSIPASTGGNSGPIADQTVLGNVSGAPAAPVGLSKAQLLTLAGVTPFNDARAAVLIRAQALLGATASVITGTEFGSSADFTSTGSASGTVTLSTSDSGGVVQVSTTATGSRVAACRMAGAPASVKDFRTVKWYAYKRAAITTAIDSATQVSLGVWNFAGNTILDLGVRGGTSTTDLCIFFRDPSGATIRATQATAAPIDTNYHDWEFWNDGTNFNIAYDGTVLYTVAVASTAGTEYGENLIYCANNGTAANRQVNCDRMYFVTASN